MCGRFGLHVSTQKIAEFFTAIQPFDYQPRFNIAPTESVVVVLERDDHTPRHLDLFRWGLIPHWAADAKIASHLVNARSESAAEKPSFRAALKYRRCILPASGFFEWRREGKQKQAYYISPSQEPLLAMAGLWETWTDPASGNDLSTCCILTTQANGVMRPIHDRMPVLLSPRDFSRWLDPHEHRPEAFFGLFAPCRDALIKALPVSSYVNRAGHEGPACIEPQEEVVAGGARNAYAEQEAEDRSANQPEARVKPAEGKKQKRIDPDQLSLF